VLHGLTFAVPTGRVVGLLGPSGCGKSTLIRAIVGLQLGVSGALTVLDLPAGSAKLRPRVGYVTQASSVYGDLTVLENLRFFAAIARVGDARVNEVLALVELERFAGRVVRSLSGGQRSRVSVAAALLGSPELLLLDEPTVGLDPVLRKQLWDAFTRLAHDDGVTLLVSSHVMDEAARCDDLLLMRDGRLVAQLTPQQLREQTGESALEDAFLRLVEQDEARTDTEADT
jgi:ABC-2 type transport system ATP-binding protein